METDSFELKGGLNLVDPPIAIPDGMLLAATNYELLPRGGYRRIDGFERSDGQPRPSEASYWILNFDTGWAVDLQWDSLVVGQTSGAVGKFRTHITTGGSYAGSTATGYFVLITLSGIFQDDEPLSVTNADPDFGIGFSSGFS